MDYIGNVSPEFPMHCIIDAEPKLDRNGQKVLAITLNGNYDGVHSTYYVPRPE